jgi:hypothetical protein
MTKDQYLMMCEQTGEEIDWEKCPPDWADFPDIVISIFSIFNSLGDRVYVDVGYVGKDFTNLKFLIKHYNIEEHQIEYVFNTILWLDGRAIKESQKRIKSETDRIKNKR